MDVALLAVHLHVAVACLVVPVPGGCNAHSCRHGNIHLLHSIHWPLQMKPMSSWFRFSSCKTCGVSACCRTTRDPCGRTARWRRATCQPPPLCRRRRRGRPRQSPSTQSERSQNPSNCPEFTSLSGWGCRPTSRHGTLSLPLQCASPCPAIDYQNLNRRTSTALPPRLTL